MRTLTRTASTPSSTNAAPTAVDSHDPLGSDDSDRCVVVVDMTNHCHRQFFGLRDADLRSSSGIPTGVVYGMVQLIKILQRSYPNR